MKRMKLMLTAIMAVALCVSYATTKSVSSDETATETASVGSDETSAKTISAGPEDPLAETRLLKTVFVEKGSFSTDGTDIPNVTLTRDYYMGIYEVTQGQYNAVMTEDPANAETDNLPKRALSWMEAVEFCNALSVDEGLTAYYTINGTTVTSADVNGKGYRLPTEAEWEYAARGGKNNEDFIYAGSDDIGGVAWYKDNSGETPKEVGTKTANSLGIFDMSGNVQEWCWDWFEREGLNYPSTPSDPQGPDKGELTLHAARGGHFNNSDGVRKRRGSSSLSSSGIGFRVVRSL